VFQCSDEAEARIIAPLARQERVTQSEITGAARRLNTLSTSEPARSIGGSPKCFPPNTRQRLGTDPPLHSITGGQNVVSTHCWDNLRAVLLISCFRNMPRKARRKPVRDAGRILERPCVNRLLLVVSSVTTPQRDVKVVRPPFLATGRIGRQEVARHAGAVVRCAGRLQGAPPRLPSAPEAIPRGIAISRAGDRPTGAGDGGLTPRAPRGSAAAGRGTGSGSGFGAADHCRSRCPNSDVCFAQEPVVLGGRLPWR
jgi:hypothetical protein